MSDSTRPRSFNPPEHERFVKRYIRLPLKIAVEFTESGVPLLDLLDAGNVALMHAAGEFEPFLGESFAEFAAGKIREAMRVMVERRVRGSATEDGQRRSNASTDTRQSPVCRGGDTGTYD